MNTIIETFKQYLGFNGLEALGGTAISEAKPGTLSGTIGEFFDSVLSGTPDTSLLPESKIISPFAKKALNNLSTFNTRSQTTKNLKSDDVLRRAKTVSELWSPELTLNNDDIFNSWRLSNVIANPVPYKPEEVIIQLNALYSPGAKTAPSDIDKETAGIYNAYMKTNPEKIAVYDHPVPVFTRGNDHELEKCLAEMDLDIEYEKKAGVFPASQKLKVLVSISTTHRGLDAVCEKWLQKLVISLKLNHIQCYLLSENKSRNLDKILGNAASIFTVQGKYACHFGALKYAQLFFEKVYGTKAGFKLDTDEGMHSQDMKNTTGKTWLEQLTHPYWGGTAKNSNGEKITIGFNIGEYVDSRDLDALGYEQAIKTPEVKTKKDMRGPYLIFNKGICQAKGTMLLNRTEKIEDYISHPLVKGGGYGIDNASLRKAVPVGFSMVGRAEDQQFYFSAINNRVQGIFNPLLRIIHYKEDVAKSEHQHMAARNVADIYRMLLFKKLMTYLKVVNETQPFPANYASNLSLAQSFFLWIYLIFSESAAGREETAEEYLSEGISQLIPLLSDIESGKVTKQFDEERAAWNSFILAVDNMDKAEAKQWLESLMI